MYIFKFLVYVIRCDVIIYPARGERRSIIYATSIFWTVNRILNGLVFVIRRGDDVVGMNDLDPCNQNPAATHITSIQNAKEYQKVDTATLVKAAKEYQKVTHVTSVKPVKVQQTT